MRNRARGLLAAALIWLAAPAPATDAAFKISLGTPSDDTPAPGSFVTFDVILNYTTMTGLSSERLVQFDLDASKGSAAEAPTGSAAAFSFLPNATVLAGWTPLPNPTNAPAFFSYHAPRRPRPTTLTGLTPGTHTLGVLKYQVPTTFTSGELRVSIEDNQVAYDDGFGTAVIYEFNVSSPTSVDLAPAFDPGFRILKAESGPVDPPVNAVPAPASLLLLAAGSPVLLALARRRRHAAH